MGRFLVMEQSFIGNQLVEKGTEVDYEGAAASNLKPLDEPAKADAAKNAKAVKESAKRLSAAANGGATEAPEVDAESLSRQQAAADHGDAALGSALA